MAIYSRRIAIISLLTLAGATGVASASLLRKHKTLLTKPCTVQVRDTEFMNGSFSHTYECELDPEDTGGIEGIIFPIKKGKWIKDAGIVAGETTIFATNSYVKKNKLKFGRDTTLGSRRTVEAKDTNKRKSQPITPVGNKRILLVRIHSDNGREKLSLSEERFSDSVFSNSADRNGADTMSVKTQFAKCSHGKLNIIEAGGHSQINNGVITVRVREKASEGSSALRNAATSKLTELFDTSLTNIADLVMFCVPPKSMRGIAYAYTDGYFSVYSDKWCSYVSAQMHEIGHNFNLGHSNERGSKYEDRRLVQTKRTCIDLVCVILVLTIKPCFIVKLFLAKFTSLFV